MSSVEPFVQPPDHHDDPRGDDPEQVPHPDPASSPVTEQRQRDTPFQTPTPGDRVDPTEHDRTTGHA